MDPDRLLNLISANEDGMRRADMRAITHTDKGEHRFTVLTIGGESLVHLEKQNHVICIVGARLVFKEIKGRAMPATSVLARTVSGSEIEELNQELERISTDADDMED